MSRVIRLPDHGRLIVCTDLQGCLRDFEAVVRVFLQADEESGGAGHLIFTGDLIHGPYIDEDDWPDFLGEYYRDQSGEIIDRFVTLSHDYPGRIHALLGNHEHGHVGGPHTAKFAMDEVALLEENLGQAASARLRAVLGDFALAAIAPCGAVLTHGAPAAYINSVADVERVTLSGYDFTNVLDIMQVPVLGPILWARAATPAAARRFIDAMGGTFSVYGHDVVPEGFECIGDEQIVVSTSFGVLDTHKVYLDLDLAARYRNVGDLRVGHEIRPLYPDRAHKSLGGLAD